MTHSATSPPAASSMAKPLEPVSCDWAKLFDQAMQGAAEMQNATLQAASQYSATAAEIYQQTPWLVPGMFWFDMFAQAFANLVDMQKSVLALILEQSRMAVKLQADVSKPMETATDAFYRGMDIVVQSRRGETSAATA